MTANISLFDLVNLSIGTPEIGAVNFNALRTLLHTILEQLNIQNVTAEWREPDVVQEPRGGLLAKTTLPAEKPSLYQHMEDKLRHMENKISALDRLPNGKELLSRTASGATASVNEMWQLMQLRGKVEANEEGVSKCMALIQDLLKEIQELKETRDHLKTEILALQHQLEQHELKEKVALYPHPEELSQCVSWEDMQAALVSDRKRIKKVSPREGLHGMADSSRSMGPDLGGSLEVLLPEQPVSQVSSGAERYPEMVEALRELGQLQENHQMLEARVEYLEGVKADQVQVQQLQEIISDIGEKDNVTNILEQVNYLKTQMDTLTADREKVCTLKIEEDVEMLKKETSVMIEKGRGAHEYMQDQLDSLRAMLEDMMRSSSTMLSWSLQQGMSDPNQGQQGKAVTQEHRCAQAAGKGIPGGPSCQAASTSLSSMVDISRKVSQLFQRYEELHGMVTGFINQQESYKTEQIRSSESISELQGAILQLQAECKKLHSTTSQLIEAHIQKQSHIDHLYKTMEELEEKKADREVVEMEIGTKADKQALETKVSRMQFDSMTEQLNGMFEELLNKITGHEQDWHKVIEKISKEMECKLNRIELDPLKKQLEDRWKSIHKQLQAQPVPEHDDAAGFKKQLVSRFHCISCDRPVDMPTPGPHLVTVPLTPGLPSHKTHRPCTIYEREHVRQHSRSPCLKPGMKQGHSEVVSPDRNSAHMHGIHNTMCKQVDRAKRKFRLPRTQEPFSGQGQRGLTRIPHPPVLGPLQRTRQSPPKKHEPIPEMSDYGYQAMSRSCGGSHTLISANQRHSRLKQNTHLIQPEEDSKAMSSSGLEPKEVDILGLDVHIYKGRLNNSDVKSEETRLPAISPKEGNRTESSSASPLRKTQGSQLATGRRPVVKKRSN